MNEVPAPSSDATPTHAPAAASPRPAASDEPTARRGGFRLGLFIFSLILVAWTFVLLVIGGNVTSWNAGLSVPDWPGTFGYWLFLAPLDKWVRDPQTGRFFFGQFWEHFHRLNAMAVGLLTLGFAIWLWWTQRQRDWLRWLGMVLLAAVVVQAFMGGFRVTDHSAFLAGVHGVFGQLFFGAVVLAAAAVGTVWMRGLTGDAFSPTPPKRRYTIDLIIMFLALAVGVAWAIFRGTDTASRITWKLPQSGDVLVPALIIFCAIPVLWLAVSLRRVWKGRRIMKGKGWSQPAIASVALVAALGIQLVLGAAVRHTAGAARAIPDAPLVLGHLAPPGTPKQLKAEIAAMPKDLRPPPTTTLPEVHLHYTHRAWAFVVTAIAVWLVIALARARMLGAWTAAPLLIMLGLLVLQIMLGVMTVWTKIYPTMATMHQANGAALLGVCVWLSARVHLARRITEQRAAGAPAPAGGQAAPAAASAGASP